MDCSNCRLKGLIKRSMYFLDDMFPDSRLNADALQRKIETRDNYIDGLHRIAELNKNKEEN